MSKVERRQQASYGRWRMRQWWVSWVFLIDSYIPDLEQKKPATQHGQWTWIEKSQQKPAFSCQRARKGAHKQDGKPWNKNQCTQVSHHREKCVLTPTHTSKDPVRSLDLHSWEAVMVFPNTSAQGGVRKDSLRSLDFHPQLTPLPSPLWWCWRKPSGKSALSWLPSGYKAISTVVSLEITQGTWPSTPAQ